MGSDRVSKYVCKYLFSWGCEVPLLWCQTEGVVIDSSDLEYPVARVEYLYPWMFVAGLTSNLRCVLRLPDAALADYGMGDQVSSIVKSRRARLETHFSSLAESRQI